MKNKVLALGMILMAFCMLIGCGAQPVAAEIEESSMTESATAEVVDSAAHSVAAIQEKGVLVVATESQYAPFCFKDANGEIVGYEPQLMQYIADSLGVTLEIMDVDFTAVIPAVQSGAADIGMAGLVKTPERTQAVDFTNLYHLSGQCLMVLKENEAKYTDIASFAGTTIGAQKGTLQETIALEQFAESEAKILPKVPNLVQEVKVGNIDALVIARAPAQAYINANDDLVLVDPGIVIDPETNGQMAVVAKGNDDLATYVNQVIAELEASGELDQWFEEAQSLSDTMTAE